MSPKRVKIDPVGDARREQAKTTDFWFAEASKAKYYLEQANERIRALEAELAASRKEADRDRAIASACGEAICSVEYDGYHSDSCLTGRAAKAEAELAETRRQLVRVVEFREKAEAERDALKNENARVTELEEKNEHLRGTLSLVKSSAVEEDLEAVLGWIAGEGGGRDSGSGTPLADKAEAICGPPRERAAVNPAAHLHRGEYCYHHGMRFDVEACEESPESPEG